MWAFLLFFQNIILFIVKCGIMTKETLIEILNLSKEKDIPEKDAAFEVVGKRMCLNHYKKKYGLKVYAPGESKHSWKQRTLTVNDNYFSRYTVDTCYYAGFIAADGNISKERNRLTIGLSGKDKSFLETFAEKIESNGKIYESLTREKYSSAVITITSPKICEDLEKNFNITPQKSLTLLPPPIEDKELLDAFILGVLDGDGTISFLNKKLKDGRISKRLLISVIGTKEIVTMIKNRFEEIICGTVSNPNHKNYTGNTYTIATTDAHARKLFLHYYKIDVPKLERKWGEEKYNYCMSFKRTLPLSRRKGINVFDLDGKLVKHFDTLEEASDFTKISLGRLSYLCKLDDGTHMSKGYMCSRTKTEMPPYVPTNPFSKKVLEKYK